MRLKSDTRKGRYIMRFVVASEVFELFPGLKLPAVSQGTPGGVHQITVPGFRSAWGSRVRQRCDERRTGRLRRRSQALLQLGAGDLLCWGGKSGGLSVAGARWPSHRRTAPPGETAAARLFREV